MEKKRICFVVAAPTSADGFLTEQIRLLSSEYDVYLAANGEYGSEWKNVEINAFYSFPIRRNISVFNDVKALFSLIRYFRRMKFDAVHSITPKAGLICSLASFMTGIKHRSHTFTGQVWATRTGAMRWLLKSLDWITAHLDNHVFADGKGQRDYLIREGVVNAAKCSVMANGSICGVDIKRFEPSLSIRNRIRQELNIGGDKVVYVFLGRLNTDKGCYELLEAFNGLVKECEDAFLLMFGHVEEDVANHITDYSNLVEHENYFFGGFTNEPFNILKSSDVFVLPTHREGFGVSVIEASCAGLPVITSDVYGVVDASIDGVTGIQCTVKDVRAFKEAMKKLYDDPSLRKEMGEKGRDRIVKEFNSDLVAKAWVDFYHRILN